MATTSRRDFLKAPGATFDGTARGGSASSYARILGATDRVGFDDAKQEVLVRG